MLAFLFGMMFGIFISWFILLYGDQSRFPIQTDPNEPPRMRSPAPEEYTLAYPDCTCHGYEPRCPRCVVRLGLKDIKFQPWRPGLK